MKCKLCALLLLLAAMARAQDARTPPEPSTAAFYYVDSSNRLVPLESEVIQMKHHFQALGFEGGSTVYLVKGDKSPVRLSGSRAAEFVTRLQRRGNAVTFWMFRFESEGGSRVMPLNEFNALGQTSMINWGSALIDFNAAQYGSSSIRIVPAAPLAPGEYCVFQGSGQVLQKVNGFCFGIDGAAG